MKLGQVEQEAGVQCCYSCEIECSVRLAGDIGRHGSVRRGAQEFRKSPRSRDCIGVILTAADRFRFAVTRHHRLGNQKLGSANEAFRLGRSPQSHMGVLPDVTEQPAKLHYPGCQCPGPSSGAPRAVALARAGAA